MPESVGGLVAAVTVSEEEALGFVVTLHRLVRSLRRASPTKRIQPTQLIVLAQLTEFGALRIGEIAELVPCSQPTATAAVAGLEGDGFARREPDPDDGRAIRVVITDEGEQALLSLAHSEAEVLLQRLGSLPPDAVPTLVAAAPLLRALAESDDPESPSEEPESHSEAP